MTLILERDFQRTVVELAEVLGWKVFGVVDRREFAERLSKGFPDLVLVKPPHIIFAELKSGKGRVTTEQQEWLDLLRTCMVANRKVWVRLWRPSDMDEIEAVLRLED